MSAHTPWPWSWMFDSGKWEATIWSGDVYKIHVADVGPSEKSASEVEANARLIASSPELLEALKNTHALARLKWGNLDQNANVILEEAEAAIRKATGAE